MDLSRRLQAVAGLVTPGCRLADIGTDHAYVPIRLVESGKIPSAIAADVNEGPLLRAAEHIRICGLERQIETRRSDGFENFLPGEADSAVLAGMGGVLTIRILEGAPPVIGALRELILQPQSEIAKVRWWLTEHGYRIDEEAMVCEDGKYYPMMRAVKGEPNVSGDAEAAYGPCLLRMRHPVLREYLRKEQHIKENILRSLQNAQIQRSGQRVREVEEDLERIRTALW